MAQGSLLDLFERQFAAAFSPSKPEPAPAAEALNPFRAQFGACCGSENVRVYWCWKCNKTPGCWQCFEKHQCANQEGSHGTIS